MGVVMKNKARYEELIDVIFEEQGVILTDIQVVEDFVCNFAEVKVSMNFYQTPLNRELKQLIFDAVDVYKQKANFSKVCDIDVSISGNIVTVTTTMDIVPSASYYRKCAELTSNVTSIIENTINYSLEQKTEFDNAIEESYLDSVHIASDTVLGINTV